jgi:NADH:ubiquinone oxidoreductase subunit 6 (subunit J)
VKEDFQDGSRTIGFGFGIIPWEAIFINLLPADVNGISVVVESDCGSVFTYTANGGKPTTSQVGDRHQAKKVYEEMAVRSRFFWEDHTEGLSRHCDFDIVIYPSDEFRASYESNDALIYSGLVGVVFVFTAMLFFLYDKYVQKKQAKVMSQAKRAEAIVTSVFPKEVGLRLIKQAEREEAERVSNKKMLNNFLVEKDESFEKTNTRRKPIADLFPETTVMFADIVGFTAWSSMREPSQVFMLLESIYRDFDNIANRRKVFKVETVGDCYVAVCGLPGKFGPFLKQSFVETSDSQSCLCTVDVQSPPRRMLQSWRESFHGSFCSFIYICIVSILFLFLVSTLSQEHVWKSLKNWLDLLRLHLVLTVDTWESALECTADQ